MSKSRTLRSKYLQDKFSWITNDSRLFVENLLTFGYRIHVLPSFWGLIKDPMHWTNTWIFIEINIFAMVSLHIERLMAQGVLSKSTGKIAHVINCLLIVVAPSIQILMAPEMPIPSFISLIISIVFFLKASFFLVDFYNDLLSCTRCGHIHRQIAGTAQNQRL